MITRVEASGYGCLRSMCQDLDRFQVLVGPNGSGKPAASLGKALGVAVPDDE